MHRKLIFGDPNWLKLGKRNEVILYASKSLTKPC